MCDCPGRWASQVTKFGVPRVMWSSSVPYSTSTCKRSPALWSCTSEGEQEGRHVRSILEDSNYRHPCVGAPRRQGTSKYGDHGHEVVQLSPCYPNSRRSYWDVRFSAFGSSPHCQEARASQLPPHVLPTTTELLHVLSRSTCFCENFEIPPHSILSISATGASSVVSDIMSPYSFVIGQT